MLGRDLSRAVGGGILLGSALFMPLGLYLQWAIPGDGPYEYFVTFFSLVLPLFALGIGYLISIPLGMRRVAITVAMTVFCLVQVWLYVPQISRRIGPWEELRRLLLKKAEEVQSFREERRIPSDRRLSHEEIELAETLLFTPAPTFTFPFPRRQVAVRIMRTVPPYVGVNYGKGRNCVFDLDTMWATYCD